MKSLVLIALLIALSAQTALAGSPDLAPTSDIEAELSRLETGIPTTAKKGSKKSSAPAFQKPKAYDKKALFKKEAPKVEPTPEPEAGDFYTATEEQREDRRARMMRAPRAQSSKKIELSPRAEKVEAIKWEEPESHVMSSRPRATRKEASVSEESSELGSETSAEHDSESESEETQSASAPVESISPEMAKKLSAAEGLFAKGDYDGVIALLQANPENLPRRAIILLARAYAAKKDFMSEVRILELGRAKYPQDYVILTLLGEAYMHAKRKDDAIGAFIAAREINPRYKRAYESMLAALESAGEFYEARSVASDMIKTFGDIPKYHTALCRLYVQGDYLEKSVEVCEIATKKDPNVPENYTNLAVSLKDQEEVGKALKLLQETSKRFPASVGVQVATGEVYMKKGDYVTAYKYFKQATSADPKSARAWVGHANAAFALQKREEAVAAFIKACKADRREIKDFRLSIGKLRESRDKQWQSRYESGINECN